MSLSVPTGFLPSLVIAVALAVAPQQGISAAEVAEVSVGLDRTAKLGCWTPVRITVNGGQQGFTGQVELAAVDGEGVWARYADQGPGLQLAAGATWTGWKYVKIGRSSQRLVVRLRSSEGSVIAQRPAADYTLLQATDHWIVVVGDALPIAEAARMMQRRGGGTVVAGHLLRREQLPDRWYGWDGVNHVVLTTGRTAWFNELEAGQSDALFRWLKLGGRMLLSAGRRAAAMFGGPSRWQQVRPGEFQQLVRRWKATGLEHLAQARQQLTSFGEVGLPVYSKLRGNVVCWEGAGSSSERPLITQYPVGLGQVTYIALDLELAPLADWSSRQRLLARLLQVRSESEQSALGRASAGQLTSIGFGDLVGQMRALLEQFSQVTMVRFSWIAGLVVLYALLLGPVDFWLLRRFGRAEWTWITFPLIVLGFCLLAVFLSARWKGNQRRINQLDFVDAEIESGILRGTTFATIYSPIADRLDWDVRPAGRFVAESDMLLSWQGLPGEGVRGMQTAERAGDLRTAYQWLLPQAGHDRGPLVQQLPIDNSSTRPLVARWTAAGIPNKSKTELRETAGGLLAGRISNPWPVTLTHCAVYYENWAYRLEGSLAPGQIAQLQFSTPLDLKWLLTRRRVIESGDVSTPWDRTDVSDPQRIAEMLMFHGAAGGEAYTRLTHRYQAFLDMSSQLRLGRAILVGRSDQPAVSWRCNGRPVSGELDHHWSFYRVAFPVKRPVEHEADEL